VVLVVCVRIAVVAESCTERDPVLLFVTVKRLPTYKSAVDGNITVSVVIPVNTCVDALDFVKVVVPAAVAEVAYPSASKVPLAGNVTVVASVAVKVIGYAPDVVNESATVIDLLLGMKREAPEFTIGITDLTHD
jgi:hypothetical protein